VSQQLAGQLADSLSQLRQLYEELMLVLRRKLESMKRADSEGLNSCSARERFLAQRIAEAESHRKQVLSRLQNELGFQAGRGVTVAELAGRLQEPARSKLLIMAQGLHQLISEADRMNQVAALVAKELLTHFRRVYEAMRVTQGAGALYGPGGARELEGTERLIDAVG
jgi:hypothetical protein